MNLLLTILLLYSACSGSGSSNDHTSMGKQLNEEAEPNNKTASSSTNTLTPAAQLSLPKPSSEEKCQNTMKTDLSSCPSELACEDLGGDCIECDFNCTCVYGETVNVTCWKLDSVKCSGKSKFQRDMICRYCYQTEQWEHTCLGDDQCLPISTPRERYKSNCTVKSEVICLGNRTFNKMLPCNWTSGYNWVTALILSITLGGFGADRFYLGHWEEGIGKLFSFGGLGVWTIIDVILIAIRYLGPEDGSLYI